MAKKGNEVINLGKEDFERKSFKTAPGGTYTAKIGAKSALKDMKGGTGVNVAGTITKGPHKGVNFFDNIGPNVKWKIAQLLVALKIKKTKLTMSELLKLIKGGELRVILRERMHEGKKRNEVVQYLPLTASKEEAATDDDEDDEDLEDEELEDGDASEADEDEDEEDEADDSEDDEDDDLEEDDEDEEEEDDSDEDDEEEESDDEEEEDEDDDEEDDDDSDEEEDDEDLDDDEEDEEEDDDEEDESDEDEEELPPPPSKKNARKAVPAKKAPAKKAPSKKGRRK